MSAGPSYHTDPQELEHHKAGNDDVYKDGHTFFGDDKDMHRVRMQHPREDTADPFVHGPLSVMQPKPISL